MRRYTSKVVCYGAGGAYLEKPYPIEKVGVLIVDGVIRGTG
jgi:hypothetical protein